MKSPNLSRVSINIYTNTFKMSAANIPVQINHIHFDVVILYFI